MSQPSPPPISGDLLAAAHTRQEEANRRRLRRLKIMLPFLLVLVFVVYAFTTNFIPSESMEPTLKPGDHILTMRTWLAYPAGSMPQRGDIIVFQLPPQQGDNGQSDSDADAPVAPSDGILHAHGFFKTPKGDILIKRVVGLPGETVQVRGNDVYINGKKLQQDYQIIPVTDVEDAYFPYAVDAPLKVPEGHLFVMGDNRNNSDDGRFWGTLPRGNVLGKFVRLLWNEGQNGPNEKRAEKEQQATQGNQGNP